jgi:hypothetical protein
MLYIKGKLMSNINDENHVNEEEALSAVEEAHRWAACFRLEKQLYEYVLEHCEPLYSQSPPAFLVYEQNGKVIEKAPPYIRWIGKLKEENTAFLTLLNELKAAFAHAKDKAFDGTYPLRYARYYDNVEHISTSTNEAWKSWRVKAVDKLVLMKSFPIIRLAGPLEGHVESLEYEAKQLSYLGLKAHVSIGSVLSIPTHLMLHVEEKALFDYFGTKHIQARQHTGTHFRARLRHVNESKGERIPLSFLVIDAQSPITQVYESLSQGARPHQLSKIGKELEWPSQVSQLDYLLYDKAQ